jgi:hypothetical protein
MHALTRLAGSRAPVLLLMKRPLRMGRVGNEIFEQACQPDCSGGTRWEQAPGRPPGEP